MRLLFRCDCFDKLDVIYSLLQMMEYVLLLISRNVNHKNNLCFNFHACLQSYIWLLEMFLAVRRPTLE